MFACCLSVVCNVCIIAKRCVLEQKLLLTAYRKSYLRNRLVPNEWHWPSFRGQEIIFVDKQRKHNFAVPSKIKEIQRVDALKILGVTVTNGLSVSLHIQTVISSCAQTLYALRVLRAHGLQDSALHNIYRSVVLAKLLYASSSWTGFSNATNRQKLQAFLKGATELVFATVKLMILPLYVLQLISNYLTES